MAHIQKTYDYTDETGNLLFQVCRFYPKDFRQRRPDPDKQGQYLWGLDSTRRVLYRLPKVVKERNLILLVEGEKDVETAEKLGFVATTAPMGAQKWQVEYNESLKGVDTLAIIADNDDPGKGDALKKAAALRGVVSHVKIVECLPGLEQVKGGDLSDWYKAAKDKKPLSQALLKLIYDTPDYTPVVAPLLHGTPLAKPVKSLDDFLAYFQGVKKTKSGYQCQCPAHDDQKASLSVAEKDDKILIRCHAGCSVENIVKAVGLEMKHLFLKDQKSDVQFVQFWYEMTVNEGQDNERIELKIDYSLFLEFLQKNGFGLYIQDKQISIVRVNDNVVETTLEKGNMNLTIKHFTLNYLAKLKQKPVRELMLKRHSTFFCTAFLTSLPPLELSFYRDGAGCCTLFFKNGFVKVSKSGVTFLPYDKLSCHVWESHILDREYHGTHSTEPVKTNGTPSVFERFLINVSQETCGQQDSFEILADNFPAFKYAYAYLLHDHKDFANARAVVCVDNDAGYEANGRRGKSLFCEALKKLRKVSMEDGRTLKTDNNQFLFQTLDIDSQILFVDDVKPRFDFATFYNAITGDLALEKKRNDRLILGFLDSPKIVMTTNHAILGNGDSHLGRWYILPFVRHYSLKYTPLDEFKQRFFVEWDGAEWQRFFDFTISCLQEYFQSEKPIVADLATYNESKLKSSMPAEFLEYFEKYLGDDSLPYEVSKDLFYQDFRQSYPLYEKLTKNKFTGKLNTYCKMRGLVINRNYDAGRCWKMEGQEKVEYLVFEKEE